MNLDPLLIVNQDSSKQRDFADSLRNFGPINLPKFVVDPNIDYFKRMGLPLNDEDEPQSLFKPFGHTPLSDYCFKCGYPSHIYGEKCIIKRDTDRNNYTN